MKQALVIILLFVLSSSLYASDIPSKGSTIPLTEDEYYTEGFEALMRIDQDMQTVIRFVKTEQGKLLQTRKLLSDLKAEKDKLAVLVNADQEIVDALFEHQEKKDQDKIWSGRTESFSLGFFSSLAVVVVVYLLKKYRSSVVSQKEV